MQITLGFCVINAISLESSETVVYLLEKSPSGDWVDSYGHSQHPYHTQEIEIEVPPMPEGWIEHLAECARKFALQANKIPSLTKLLGLTKPSTHPSLEGKLERRI